MNLRAIFIGIIAGSIAVLALWLTRVILPPREPELPEVIRLDTLRDYADRPSASPEELIANADLLERVVPSFSVAGGSVEEAVRALGAAAFVNIVVVWDRFDPDRFREKFPLTLSLQSKTVSEILEMIFDPPYPEEAPDVGWFVRGGVVYITDDGSAGWPSPRVYDVRDLMAQAARTSAAFVPATRRSRFSDSTLQGSEQDAVERLLNFLVEDDFVSDGGVNVRSAEYFAGRLLVDANRAGHRQVEERLRLLRKTN